MKLILDCSLNCIYAQFMKVNNNFHVVNFSIIKSIVLLNFYCFKLLTKSKNN